MKVRELIEELQRFDPDEKVEVTVAWVAVGTPGGITQSGGIERVERSPRNRYGVRILGDAECRD